MSYCSCLEQETKVSESEKDLEDRLETAAKQFINAYNDEPYGSDTTRKAGSTLRDAALAYTGYIERMHGFPNPA